MDDDEEAELRNPFPSPPSHYLNYTSHNLKLLSLLRERTGSDEPDLGNVNQHAVLSDQSDVPDWPLGQLEKPRVDWILEDGQYNVFGDTWLIKENIPSLAELGGNQLYTDDSGTGFIYYDDLPSSAHAVRADRRPTLVSILKSMLVTYSKLLSALLAPPATTSTGDAKPDWQRHVEWITVLSQNIMAAANDLRPVQARMNLELLMKRQIELRKLETNALHSKCDELEVKLAQLRTSVGELSRQPSEPKVEKSLDEIQRTIVETDVLQWAEDIR